MPCSLNAPIASICSCLRGLPFFIIQRVYNNVNGVASIIHYGNIWDMNKTNFKSVSLDRETYEIISNLSQDQDRTLSATIRRLTETGMVAEAEEANLDSLLIDGGTPRFKRLLEDLGWYRDNSDNSFGRKWIVDEEEKEAILIVIDALADSIE